MKNGASLWRRFLRLLAPRPRMCAACGDAMLYVRSVDIKALTTTLYRCANEACGTEVWT